MCEERWKCSQAPSNWQSSLRIDANKAELQYLSGEIVSQILSSKVIVTAFANAALSKNHPHLQALASCNHKEADTRVFLHTKDMASNNLSRLFINSSDTDVVIISVALYHYLGVQEFWLDMGTGQKGVFFFFA